VYDYSCLAGFLCLSAGLVAHILTLSCLLRLCCFGAPPPHVARDLL